MRFNIVIGNPPYQSPTNNKLYCDFMVMANDICSDKSCLLVKNRWMSSIGTDTLDIIHRTFLIDKHCRKIVDFPVRYEVFPDISAYVNYYLYDKNNPGDCEYIAIMRGKETERYTADFSTLGMVPKSKLAMSIIEKSYDNQNNFSHLMIDRKPAGFETNGIKENRELFVSSKDREHSVRIIGLDEEGYISEYDLLNKSNIHGYKVVVGEKVNAWESPCESVITNIKILGPYELCTGTWTQLYHTDCLSEAEHFVKYLKTKFCRYLIKSGYTTYGGYVAEYLRFCPMQDFTDKSDINWDLDIASIDRYLYTKYKISDLEVSEISSLIKDIE